MVSINIFSSTTVFNIDNNQKYVQSNKCDFGEHKKFILETNRTKPNFLKHTSGTKKTQQNKIILKCPL